MEINRSHSLLALAGLAAVAFLVMPSQKARADVLSDNLSSPGGGAETALGDSWLAASFATDATPYQLNTVTLLLANSSAAATGAARVDIYTDGGLQPGVFLGTLTSPGSYSPNLANTTFTANGLTLAAHATYWTVLKADSGSFDWSFASDDNGTGAGFTDTWSSSADAGTTWFTFTGFPLQMRVQATPVPEPGALALLASGGVLGTGLLLRRRRGRAAPPLAS